MDNMHTLNVVISTKDGRANSAIWLPWVSALATVRHREPWRSASSKCRAGLGGAPAFARNSPQNPHNFNVPERIPQES
jgi:hypothetical protein